MNDTETQLDDVVVDNEIMDNNLNDKDTHNPTPAMEIEGIVRGEPDNNNLQSGGSLVMDDDLPEEVFRHFFT